MPLERRLTTGSSGGLLLLGVFAVTYLCGVGAGVGSIFGPPTPLMVVIGVLLEGPLFGIAFTALVVWSWRRTGGPREIQARSRAVREGRLPEDATAAEWRKPLEVRAQNLRQIRWFFPLLWAGLMGIGVLAGLHGNVIGAAFWFAFALMTGAIGLRALLRIPHDLPTLERFLEELDRRETEAAAS